MDTYQKVVEVFTLNGEIHSCLTLHSKNELMLLLSKRNKILREIGFTHGNFILNGGELELFEDPTTENIDNNVNLIMALIAPLLYEIIKSRSKEFPDFMLAVNATGRMEFTKGLVSLVHAHASAFEKIDLIIKEDKIVSEILDKKRAFGPN